MAKKGDEEVLNSARAMLHIEEINVLFGQFKSRNVYIELQKLSCVCTC